MPTENHDTIVYRLAQILIKLNQGEKLNPKDLAEEFGVNLRTIQRDLNIRFAYLPLEKVNRSYQLSAHYLGKLSTKDIERFAGLAGVRGLFPSLSDEFLGEIFDTRIEASTWVQGHHYEDISQRKKEFSSLEAAIRGRNTIDFSYEKNGELKFYSEVAPYKLINNKGIWYLAALDVGKLKTFSFTKISRLNVHQESFRWDEQIHQKILNEDGIWVSEKKQIIGLLVSGEVAHYFKRRRLIPHQNIVEERSDGSLIVETTVGHINQILPIIRYWIPHVRVISPTDMQTELEKQLRNYLGLE